LAVDKNIAVCERESIEWARYGVDTKRVSTIGEAISLLAHDERYLFVAINEDSLPSFMTQLHIICDVTDTPIFVVTSSYSVKKEIYALQHGADSYSSFGASARENVLSGLELLKLKERWAGRQHESLPVLTGGNMILSPSHRIVFVDDTKIALTKKEFNVLQYLMENSGHFVPHIKLLKKIWGDEYGENDAAVLWQTVDRLRKKLSKKSPADKYIIVERSVGYMFSLD